MKHGVDRYNLYHAYKRSKISKQIHATAVNCVIVALLIQQLLLLFFNIIRGQPQDEDSSGSRLPPRAIFSVTMFTTFLAMFVGQIFFHSFLGFSPIQYNPVSESHGRSTNKNSNSSSRRDSSDKGRYDRGNDGGEELYQQQIIDSTDGDGTELVYGEFGQFGRQADLNFVSPRDDIFQVDEDDIFGHRLTSQRRFPTAGTSRQSGGPNCRRNNKRYLPDVLRKDVFAGTNHNLQPQTAQNSLVIQENGNYSNGINESENVDATFRRNGEYFQSVNDRGHSPSQYGAITEEPKREQKRV